MSGIGRVKAVERDNHVVVVKGTRESLRIEAYENSTLRFHYSKNRTWERTPSFAAVFSPRPLAAVRAKENPDRISIRAAELSITVERDDGSICISDSRGPLMADLPGHGYVREGNGVRTAKLMGTTEAILGLGERLGPLDKTGSRITNWNSDISTHTPSVDELYQTHPFFIAWEPSRSFGVFIDNTFWSRFDMGRERPDRWTFSADGGELDLYFFGGPTPKDVLARYTALTGRFPMPPLWAMGYQQSRWGYMSGEEVQSIAQEFRDRRIPCDVVYLDIDHMDGYRVFTSDRSRFPNIERFIRGLREKGFKVVVIADPGVKKDPRFAMYRDGLAKGAFCMREDGSLFTGHVWPGECAFPDFLSEKARTWWGDHQKKVIDWGVAGVWNDMNEPVAKPPKDSERPEDSNPRYRPTMTPDVMHGEAPGLKPGGEGRGGRGAEPHRKGHDEMHNVYGLAMARASYEGWRRHSAERPLVITRAGYAGVQRYSAVWTGDNHSWWEHLSGSITMLQNLSASGVPLVGSDIGGFGGEAGPELFARWIELGVFYPFCRNHSIRGSRYQEPWRFGPQVEAISRKHIELRYRLIPYLYSLMWEAHRSGIPPMRPMVMEFPSDPRAIHAEDQFMLGPNLLIAPVYRPGGSARAVYLPNGAWYDAWTGERCKGGRTVAVEAPLDRIPVFVRGGSVTPLWDVQQFVGEKPQSTLTILSVPGPASSFLYYEDDGSSWDYEKGTYVTIELRRAADGRILRKILHAGRKPSFTRIRLTAHL